MRIYIDYSDGRHTWGVAPPEMDSRGTIEVPDSIVALWKAAADLDRVIGEQLLALDNEIHRRRETEAEE